MNNSNLSVRVLPHLRRHYYVKALQKCWKAFAEHKKVRDCGIQTVMGEDCHVEKINQSSVISNKTRPNAGFLAIFSEYTLILF